MRGLKGFIIIPIVLILIVSVVPLFFSINLPLLVKNEIETMIKEYILPNNPRYKTYTNEAWKISFDYPTHLQMAEGASQNEERYVIFFFGPGYENYRNIDPDSGEDEMIGVHLFKNRNLEEEIQRVSVGRSDLIKTHNHSLYTAVEIQEYANKISGMQQGSVIIEKGDVLASFFVVRNKDNKDIRSFFEHMVNTFKFME